MKARGFFHGQQNSTYLYADVTELTFTVIPSDEIFNIESNADWVIDTSSEFVTCVPSSGFGDAEITVSKTDSTTPELITISAPGVADVNIQVYVTV